MVITLKKLLDYLKTYLNGQNRSRVAIVLAPLVSSGAAWAAKQLGLDPTATLAVVIGVLAHFGLYIRNNGLQENATNYVPR